MRKRKSSPSRSQSPDQPPDLGGDASSALVEELNLNAGQVAEETLVVTPSHESIYETRQAAVTDEEKVQSAEAESQLNDQAEAGSEPGFVRRMNEILAEQVHGKVLGVALLAGLVAMAWLYWQIPAPPVPPDKTVELALQAGLMEAKAQMAEQQKDLNKLAEKVEALTQELKLEREHTQARFQEVSGRLAEAIRQKLAAPLSSGPVATPSTSIPNPEAVLQPTEARAELLLLKERNRLTDYADKAIATGSRDALQAVVETMFDPEKQNLHHAAQAEFRRVQAFYEISASIDPAYKLPLLELFKDGSVKSEAEIKPVQLMALMKDARQPWEVRLRCAYLLRESPDKDVNAALLQALKEDVSLDVAKQAQTSLERRLGKRFRLFDIPAVEAWLLAHPQN
jgi:hypothetical protein